MKQKTALNQLLEWIENFEQTNGTPTMFEIKSQIDLFKEVEKEQILKTSIDTTRECWESLAEHLGIDKDKIFSKGEIENHRVEAEEYYNEIYEK